MDKCLWVGMGYPVFIAAVVALWGVYQKSLKDTRAAELLLLQEKDLRINELEAFQKIIEDRLKGTGRKT